MKEWKLWILALVLGWMVPYTAAVLVLGGGTVVEKTAPSITDPVIQPKEAVWITVVDGEKTRTMDLEEYLVGVLLGEIPGSFHIEAKKAQAVVARTYTLRTIAENGKHPGAVCTDSGCCQAYCDPASVDEDTSLEVRLAVRATAGQVLTYEGALIEATYFSCSGGYTEDAVAVWGSDVPYLQAVPSPGEEMATHYTDTVTFQPEELAIALGQKLSGSPDRWFGAVTYTQGGGVDTIRIGQREYTGKALRALLGLRSTAFTVEVHDEQIRFVTRGFGHRVGMSQYGAQAMALAGSNYQQILAHYYTDTQLAEYP